MGEDESSAKEEKDFEDRVRRHQQENTRLGQFLKKKVMEKKLATIRDGVSREKLLYGMMETGEEMESRKFGAEMTGGAVTDPEQLKLLKKKKPRLGE